MSSLGLSCNFYREPYALPGFLAMATSGYFDDVVMVSSPPSDAKPDEESIELVKAAGVRLVHTNIDAGYGMVRTRCIRESKAEWVLIMDCDERFLPVVPQMRCEGTEKYPEVKAPDVKVFKSGRSILQGEVLKDKIKHAGSADCIRLMRRHWFGPPEEMMRPCQNFDAIPDWQLRCVRNSQFIFFDPERKMHEHLKNSRTWAEPTWVTADNVALDHFHCHFKGLDPEGRELAVATYNRLDKEGTENMWSVKGYE